MTLSMIQDYLIFTYANEPENDTNAKEVLFALKRLVCTFFHLSGLSSSKGFGTMIDDL